MPFIASRIIQTEKAALLITLPEDTWALIDSYIETNGFPCNDQLVQAFGEAAGNPENIKSLLLSVAGRQRSALLAEFLPAGNDNAASPVTKFKSKGRPPQLAGWRGTAFAYQLFHFLPHAVDLKTLVNRLACYRKPV